MENLEYHTLLKQLGLKDSEITVFLTMINGNVKVKDIMVQTGMKRPSVYHAMSSLEQRGLVGRIQVGEYNRWQVTDLSRLRDILAKERKTLLETEAALEEFIAHSEDEMIDEDRPRITYFEDQQAIERIVFNSLYCKDKHIMSIAPINNFFFQTGFDFATRYVAERKKRGITSKHLWEEPIAPEIIEKFYQNTAEIRILPKTMMGQFQTTIFIYDDSVMYIAPKEKNNAAIFQSAEHANMMRAMYMTIWEHSKVCK